MSVPTFELIKYDVKFEKPIPNERTRKIKLLHLSYYKIYLEKILI